MTYSMELRAELNQSFGISFDDLYLSDILRANRADVRMGTFILCAAFLDTLALCYSAGVPVRGGAQAKWRRFIKQYFGAEYAPLQGAYHDFRNLLLHNYAPVGIGFTHDDEQASRHLEMIEGHLCLHRESFVVAVEGAFKAFRADVFSDPELGQRVAEHLRQYPPLGLAILLPRTALSPATAASATNSTAWTANRS